MKSSRLSSTSTADQDDEMGEVMEEFTRTLQDLMSSKQSSQETSVALRGLDQRQATAGYHQPPVSSTTGSDSQERQNTSRKQSEKRQTAPQQMREKGQTPQQQMREKVAQQGLFLRQDSSSSQRSLLDSPDFASSPVTTFEVRINDTFVSKSSRVERIIAIT